MFTTNTVAPPCDLNRQGHESSPHYKRAAVMKLSAASGAVFPEYLHDIVNAAVLNAYEQSDIARAQENPPLSTAS